MVRYRIAAIAAAIMILATGSAAAASTRQVGLIDVGAGYVVATNDRGDIVGYGFASQRYVLWKNGGYGAVDLGIGETWGQMGINNRAEVVGHLSNGAGFLWSAGTLTTLVHPSGNPVFPVAVNDRGEVAGFRATSALEPYGAFVW